jgi:hypothetical protein
VTKDEAARLALGLVDRSEVAMLGTVSAEGEPNIKALSKVATEGLRDAETRRRRWQPSPSTVSARAQKTATTASCTSSDNGPTSPGA